MLKEADVLDSILSKVAQDAGLEGVEEIKEEPIIEERKSEPQQYADVYKFYRKEGRKPQRVKVNMPLEEAKSFCQLAPRRSKGDSRDFFHGFRIR
jgi:hypothetical protein